MDHPRCSNKALLSFFLSIPLLFFSLGAAKVTADDTGKGEVFAIINGEEIPMDVFRTSLNLDRALKNSLHGNMGFSPEKARASQERLALNLINRTLLIQEAYRTGMLPNEEEIEQHLSSTVKNFGGRDRLEAFMGKFGIQWDRYMEFTKDAFLADYFIQKALKPSVQISEEKSRAYYQERFRTYNPPGVAYVAIAVVILKPDHPGFDEILTDFRALQDSKATDDLRRGHDGLKTRYRNVAGIGTRWFSRVKVNEDPNGTYWKAVEDKTPGTATYARSEDARYKDEHYIVLLDEMNIPHRTTFEQAEPSIRTRLEARDLSILVGEKIGELKEKAEIQVFWVSENPHP